MNPFNGFDQRNVTKFKEDDLNGTASLQPYLSLTSNSKTCHYEATVFSKKFQLLCSPSQEWN